MAEGPLCCCEYENINGDKSHVLAALCDCEDVDSTCDRLLKGKRVPRENYQRISNVFLDRIRVPTCLGGGAKRLDVFLDCSSIPAIFMLPLLVLLASLHPLLTVLVYLMMPVGLLVYYQSFLRHRTRSKFFMTWGIISVLFTYVVFMRLVVPLGHVSIESYLAINVCILGMFAAFYAAKLNPGVIERTLSNTCVQNDSIGQNLKNKVALSRADGQYNVNGEGQQDVPEQETCSYYRGSPKRCGNESGDIPSHKRTVSDGQVSMLNDSVFVEGNWCEICQSHQLHRAGHCKTCEHCVKRLDHHCVWIDSCIGEDNHRAFLLSAILFVVGSAWGASLSLQSVCHMPMHGFYIAECLKAYKKNSSAVILSCTCYSILACLAMLALLLQQVHLITHNWTYRERKLANRGQLPRDIIQGYDKGFLRNWKDFILKRFDHDLTHI